MQQSLWIPFGCSVIGASHIRKNKENQDSYLPHPGIGLDGKAVPSIIAVSDGHGGNKYIRSASGSMQAVALATQIARDYNELPLSSKMRKGELADTIRHIKTRCHLSWQKLVDDHYSKNPFTDAEKGFLKENCTHGDYEAVMSNHKLAYGCTFLCAIAYEDVVLILQLGDGDILGLYPNDDVRELIKSDSRNFGNETMSLCSLKEADAIAHEILMGDEIPGLITLTTDGIRNSYNDQTSDIKAFYNIPIVLKTELQKNNFYESNVKSSIDKWLKKVTENGAGDDVTIGVLFRKDMLGADMFYSMRQALQTLKRSFGTDIFEQSNGKFMSALRDIKIDMSEEEIHNLLHIAVCDLNAYTRLKETSFSDSDITIDSIANEMSSVYNINIDVSKKVIKCIGELL